MALQSTVASIQNIRKQRQLELELVELDRQWHVELKVITRERLGLMKELCRIHQDQRAVDHLQDTMHGKNLTRFTDRAQGKLQQAKEVKQLYKYDFRPDPVERMHLDLPPIQDNHGVAKVLTAKELNKYRIQLQKSTFEQCMADRRNRRRPFWDKALIRSRRRHPQEDRHKSVPERAGSLRQPDPVQGMEIPEQYDSLRRYGGLSKSPSLPALNTLRRSDSFKPRSFHPSLSNRHSASLDYLPVIKGARGHNGLSPSLKAPSVSSVTTLPTIVEA